MSYAWIKAEAHRLSDLRRERGWRPATVEPPSFPNRCMSVLASIQAEADVEALGKLLVFLYELHPGEVDQVARHQQEVAQVIMPPEMDEADVCEMILMAWSAWRDDQSWHILMGNALTRMLVLCERRRAPLKDVLHRWNAIPPCKKGNKRHPDCW